MIITRYFCYSLYFDRFERVYMILKHGFLVQKFYANNHEDAKVYFHKEVTK